jgi:hypothetical protein
MTREIGWSRPTLLVGAAVSLTLGAAPLAHASGTNALPAATVGGFVEVCGPCGGPYVGSAYQAGVALSAFGRNYAITSDFPQIAQTGVTTPGELVVGVVGNSGSVTLNAAALSLVTTASGPDLDDTGSLDFWFEVVKTTSTSPADTVDIGVDAKGSLSVSTVGEGGGNLNDGQVTSSLLITPGPGTTTLFDQTQAYYGYYVYGGSSQIYDDNTANVSGVLGPTASFTGSFALHDDPISVSLGRPYEVQLTADVIGGGAAATGTASIDPTFIAPPGYEIEFSPGINAAVPEPSTWALMIVALGGVGAALRRRAARPATA